MSREELEKDHPQLARVSYEIRSKTTFRYNCMAFAIGFEDNQIWPIEGPYGWPLEEKEFSVNGFRQAFEFLGFRECSNGDFEAGLIKIVIFRDRDGNPSHIARQAPSERLWVSKCGDKEDIIHELEGLSGHDGRDPCGMPDLYMEMQIEDFEKMFEDHRSSRNHDESSERGVE